MSPMLTCHEISTLVSDYLDDRLGVWDRWRFRAHVAMCPHCKEWVRQLQLTQATLGRATTLEVPDELAPDLVEAFKGWTSDRAD